MANVELTIKFTDGAQHTRSDSLDIETRTPATSLLWRTPRIQPKSFVSTDSRDVGNPSTFLSGRLFALLISSPLRADGLWWPAVIS
jgi:hypothetical protein